MIESRLKIISGVNMIDKVERLIQKGKKYYNKKNYTKALDCYNKALEIKPRNVRLLYLKSFILSKMKRYEESMNSIDEAIKVQPKEIRCISLKSTLFLSMNKYEDAIKWFDEALKIEPDNIEITKKREIVEHELVLKKAQGTEKANDYLTAYRNYMKLNMWNEAERCQQKFTDQELEKTTANQKILSPQIITCPHCNKNIDLRKVSKY